MHVDLNSRPRYSAITYFLGRYRLMFSVILVLTVFSSVVDSLSVVAFFPMFSSVLGGTQEEAPGVLGFVNQAVALVPAANPVVAAAVLLICVFLAKTGFTLMREITTAYVVAKIHYEVKRNIIERYEGAHYQYMLDNPQGSLLYGSLDAPSAVSAVMLTASQMATATLKTITIVIVLVTILPLATAVLIVGGLFYYIAVHYLSSKISFNLGARKMQASMTQTVVINEFLTGFRQIIALNTSRWWLDRFDRESGALRDLAVKESLWYAIPRPVMELGAVAVMLGLILMFWLTNSGSMSLVLPTVGVFAVALAQLMPPLTSLGTLRMKMMISLPDLDLVHRTIVGPMQTRREGNRTLSSFEDAIVFEDVGFAYPGRAPLFQGLNLSIKKGTVTAIVGSSGAGKTTIVNLLLGMFEPTDGSITVDGIPLQELTRTDWLGRIGFVSQETFMSHATAASNIMLGRNGRSNEAVVEAAMAANADEFISQLPQGYETVIGERGMKLSGGQQQRLAIARALLDSPEILIFDEATSSLDSISERFVQEAIDAVSVNHTVVVIAHRLSTIRHADKIVVFDGGRVVEVGNHQDLLAKNGYYARLAGVAR